MTKIAVDILEIHASHSCNLACPSCSHFSNHHVKQNVDLHAVCESLAIWTQHLAIKEFRVLGGEPLLHDGLDELLLRLREFDLQKIQLVTNGLLFTRKDDGFGEMLAKNSISVIVSIHSEDAEYSAKLAETQAQLGEWKKKFGLDFKMRPSFQNWTRRYHGYGETLRPYNDGHPELSYAACSGKFCKQLYAGKIYKCAPVTYIQLLQAKYRLSEEWNEFLCYVPLESSASRSEMLQFFEIQDESVCGLCPSNPEHFVKDPFGRF